MADLHSWLPLGTVAMVLRRRLCFPDALLGLRRSCYFSRRCTSSSKTLATKADSVSLSCLAHFLNLGSCVCLMRLPIGHVLVLKLRIGVFSLCVSKRFTLILSGGKYLLGRLGSEGQWERLAKMVTPRRSTRRWCSVMSSFASRWRAIPSSMETLGSTVFLLGSLVNDR